MAFIGNTNTTQAFTPAIDFFSGNGSTTAFTLSRPVASVAQVQVTIDNVAQNPSSAFTVSANTITFTSAPLSGTNNVYVYYTSPITQVIAPGQGTVTATSMASSTGTGAGVFQTSPTITTPTIDTIALTADLNQTGSNTRIRSKKTGGTDIAQLGNGVLTGDPDGYGITTMGAYPFLLGTNATERMRINAGAPILCLAGGSTTATGTGIAFPATQSASSDANTLDDYEEGTWTPVVTSQSGSITSYTATGTYTKVGRIVTIYSNIQVTNIGTASGQLFINGSPFSPLGGAQTGGVCRETTATGNIYTPMAYSSTFSIQNSTNGGVAWGTNYRYESINTYQT